MMHIIIGFFGIVLTFLGTAHAQSAGAASNQAKEIAGLRLALSDMQAENARLLGRVETLEFLLGQTNDELNSLQVDDKALLEMIETLKVQNAQFAARLGKIEHTNNNYHKTGPAISSQNRPPAQTTYTTRSGQPPDQYAGSGVKDNATTQASPTQILRDNTVRDTQDQAHRNTQPTRIVTHTKTSPATASSSTPAQSTNNSGTTGARSSNYVTQSYTSNSGQQTGAVPKPTNSEPLSTTSSTYLSDRTTTRTTVPASVRNSGSSPDNSPQTTRLGTQPTSALPEESGPLFADAKAKLMRFDYAGAETSFQQFLKLFEDDPQAGEARYWLAESLHQQGAHVKSGQAYSLMLQRFPKDKRAPDALVKLARSMRLINAPKKACAALAALPKRYPNASSMVKEMATVESTRSNCSE